ncbi:MAG TPA: hypothetical protein VM492_15625 [Sumerlaeia bacterium]|nr:hypothetical protein [Sumerlaeia bacterium]
MPMSDMRNHGHRRDARKESDVSRCPPAYEPPRLVRLRVETTRMKLGYEDANQFCTVHIHDSVATDCAF